MKNVHNEFLELFLRHHAAMYAFVVSRGIRAQDAEDVVQDIASTLWKKFDSFRQGSNFKAWAFATAQIEVLRFRDRARRQGKVLTLDEGTLDRLDALQIGGHDDLIDYRKHVLLECVSRLRREARDLVRMRYGDRRSFDEISRQLKKSSAALRVMVSRIRRALQECVMKNAEGVEA
ncbi:sigma-70 family RNA polymerase sigma factor [Planctomycetota bacterium]